MLRWRYEEFGHATPGESEGRKFRMFQEEEVEVSAWDNLAGSIFSSRKKEKTDERSPEDSAAFDMFIDNALALNAGISTLPSTYYFAVPCSATEEGEDGNQEPVRSMMPVAAIRNGTGSIPEKYLHPAFDCLTTYMRGSFRKITMDELVEKTVLAVQQARK